MVPCMLVRLAQCGLAVPRAAVAAAAALAAAHLPPMAPPLASAPGLRKRKSLGPEPDGDAWDELATPASPAAAAASGSRKRKPDAADDAAVFSAAAIAPLLPSLLPSKLARLSDAGWSPHPRSQVFGVLDASIRAERAAAHEYEASLAAAVTAGASMPALAAPAAGPAMAAAAAVDVNSPAQRLAQLRRMVLESRRENEEHEIWLASLVART